MKSHGNWALGTGKWAVKFSLVLGAVLWLGVMALALAEAKADEGGGSSDDDYNFSWLDPDKKIYVLQNRKFLKAERPSLSAMGGASSSSAYRNTYNATGAFAFYFSEALGIEAFYSAFFNQENNTYAHLKQAAPTALPVVREARSQFGLNLHFVPWYAKINVFNQILYFDWYFAGGAGLIQTALDTRTNTNSPSQFKNEDFFAIFLGTGHQYYLNQDFFVRLDFTSAIYRAPRFGNDGESTWFSNNLLSCGLGFRL